MPLQKEGELSMYEIRDYLGLTGETDFSECYSTSSYLKFDSAYVAPNNPVFDERTAANINSNPRTGMEWYNYGNYGLLRGVHGNKIISGNVHIAAHFVWSTVGGFEHTDTNVSLNTTTYNTIFDPQGSPGATAYPDLNIINSGYNNLELEGRSVSYTPAGGFPTSNAIRDFQWTFSDGVDTYTAISYVYDYDYFRIGILQSGSFDLTVDENTGLLEMYILPNTGAGTGVSDVTGFTAECVIYNETDGVTVDTFNSTVVGTTAPVNGTYYDNADGGSDDTIFIKQNNSTIPSYVKSTLMLNKWYSITLKSATSGATLGDNAIEKFYVYI